MPSNVTVSPSIHSSLPREKVALLRNVTVLASLDEDSLGCLSSATEIRLLPGEILVQQGEAKRAYLLVLAGSLRMSSSLNGASDRVVHVMPEGTAFGEVTLLANIPSPVMVCAETACECLELNEEQFWILMTRHTEVRKAILSDLETRLARLQAGTSQQGKMVSLGTLAAGLMHELNNPCAAAGRASAQLHMNLMRMHELTKTFSEGETSAEQKQCIAAFQERALRQSSQYPVNSIERGDEEEALASWMESAGIAEAWKLAPTLVSSGTKPSDLDAVRNTFGQVLFPNVLSWLGAVMSCTHLVGVIDESVSRVTKLVEAVKTYAYEGRGVNCTIDINNSIDATISILNHKMRHKQITVEKEFASGLVKLETDCEGINQIWTNLLDNAIYAAPHSGKITIRTWAERVSNVQSEICVLIRDNGAGIPSQIQSRIFDPFYTTKPVGEGPGLGLGIVLRIVEQCGGTLRFDSAPGGTDFLIRLPAARELNARSDEAARTLSADIVQ